MKIKSVSGASYAVSDLSKTISFYEELGFVFRSKDEKNATAYMNWYWIILSEGIVVAPKNAPTMWLSVDDVEASYQELKNVGKKVSVPEKTVKNHQFTLQDPDGYTIAIFKRR